MLNLKENKSKFIGVILFILGIIYLMQKSTMFNWKDLLGNAKFWVSSPFGEQRGTYSHNGVDLAVHVGTPISAPFDGITSVFEDERNGKAMLLKGIGNIRLGFAHLSKFEKIGAVKKGDLIAYSGNTGTSKGPHIHFTVTLININKKVNPQSYFS